MEDEEEEEEDEEEEDLLLKKRCLISCSLCGYPKHNRGHGS